MTRLAGECLEFDWRIYPQCAPRSGLGVHFERHLVVYWLVAPFLQHWLVSAVLAPLMFRTEVSGLPLILPITLPT